MPHPSNKVKSFQTLIITILHIHDKQLIYEGKEGIFQENEVLCQMCTF